LDERLSKFGSASCIQQTCRWRNAPAAEVVTLHSVQEVGSIGISQPVAGQRIDAATLGDFVFTFDADSSVAIAAILRRQPMNTEDIYPAAVWVAYLSADDAQGGVRLSQGSAVNGAKSLLAGEDELSLYFVTLAFRHGELRALSPVTPFSIGKPYQLSGEDCNLPNDSLCAGTRPLVCVEGTCRAACLSDLDCVVEARSCAPPGHGGITSGVCL